eukprot:3151915-Prymnesium_polylepis.2
MSAFVSFRSLAYELSTRARRVLSTLRRTCRAGRQRVSASRWPRSSAVSVAFTASKFLKNRRVVILSFSFCVEPCDMACCNMASSIASTAASVLLSRPRSLNTSAKPTGSWHNFSYEIHKYCPPARLTAACSWRPLTSTTTGLPGGAPSANHPTERSQWRGFSRTI